MVIFMLQWTGDSLVCTQLHPPINPHVDWPLRPRPVFSIKLNYEKEVEVLCLKGFHGPHPCEVSMVTNCILTD